MVCDSVVDCGNWSSNCANFKGRHIVDQLRCNRVVCLYLYFDLGITEDILGILLLICINAIVDFKKIVAQWYIDHRKEGLVQFSTCAALGMVCTEGVWNRIFLICLNLSLFWLGFDYLLNWLRGKDWYHLGNNFFDRILSGYKMRYYRLALKVSLLIAFSVLYQLL